jgi:tetratricopeptide (TPR) repeat protein
VEIDAQNLERERSACLHWLRETTIERGDFSAALGHQDAALRSLETRRSQVARLAAAGQVAWFAERLGDYDTALRTAREALPIAREQGVGSEAVALWHIGAALLYLGDYGAAREPLGRVTEIWERRKQFGQLPMGQAFGAIAHARSGDVAQARALIDAARRSALQYDWLAQSWNEQADAEVCEAEGHPERSAALFQKALDLIPPAFAYDVTQMRVALAKFLLRQHRPFEARPHLEAARDFFKDPVAFRRRAEVEALLRQCDAVRA